MKLYCYHIMPIDHWDGMRTAQQVIEDAVKRMVGAGFDDGEIWTRFDIEMVRDACNSMIRLLKLAAIGFRRVGWEGDMREGPFFFSMPGEVNTLMGVALKQDNNGGTFVGSPVPLPNLMELLACAPECVFDSEEA